ncbi:GntR family transcriptional regulator [Thermomonospora echinospora]|uniref:GntR family transcriptional regulator n=1 Tax=Thermomonospora echinospora TaxID=1992 RepID=A0A1H6E5L7_9ACTN|nr:GntR family transcriptional regulator [Thermomonospora echinospora]SEG92185.1 GntR family transcriptional regulator [Thermomonospora echinospora]
MSDSPSRARWRELTDFMRTDILDGHYQPGQALPGEAHLADTYATSRPTVRKAIAQLAAEGLLTVSHGRGTFVRPRPDRRLIVIGQGPHLDLLAPNSDLAAQGWEPVTVPSDAERQDPEFAHGQPIPNPCGLEEAEALGIRTGTKVIHRYAFWQHTKTRTRIYLDSNIPRDLLTTDDQDAEIQPQDYYAHLADRYGPVRWTTTVHATMPTGHMTEDLNMEATGTPTLVIRRIMLNTQGRPLEVTEIHAPADRFEATSATDHDPTALADITALHL